MNSPSTRLSPPWPSLTNNGHPLVVPSGKCVCLVSVLKGVEAKGGVSVYQEDGICCHQLVTGCIDAWRWEGFTFPLVPGTFFQLAVVDPYMVGAVGRLVTPVGIGYGNS